MRVIECSSESERESMRVRVRECASEREGVREGECERERVCASESL